MNTPKGAITSLEELMKYKGEVIFHVGQNGRSTAFIFEDSVTYEESNGEQAIPGEPRVYYKGKPAGSHYSDSYSGHLGDVNILDHCNEHYLFHKMQDAVDYAIWMRTDPGYQSRLAKHHKWCDEMFSDWSYDSDFL